MIRRIRTDSEWEAVVEQRTTPVLVVSTGPKGLGWSRRAVRGADELYNDSLQVVVCPHELAVRHGAGLPSHAAAVQNADELVVAVIRKPSHDESHLTLVGEVHAGAAADTRRGLEALLHQALGPRWHGVTHQTSQGVKVVRFGSATLRETCDESIFGTRSDGFEVHVRQQPDDPCGYLLEIWEHPDVHMSADFSGLGHEAVRVMHSHAPYALNPDAVVERLQPHLTRTSTGTPDLEALEDCLGSLEDVLSNTEPHELGQWGRAVAYADEALSVDHILQHEMPRVLEGGTTDGLWGVAQDALERLEDARDVVMYGSEVDIRQRLRTVIVDELQERIQSRDCVDCEAVVLACGDQLSMAAAVCPDFLPYALSDHLVLLGAWVRQVQDAVLQSDAHREFVRDVDAEEAAEFLKDLRIVTAAAAVAAKSGLGHDIQSLPPSAWEALQPIADGASGQDVDAALAQAALRAAPPERDADVEEAPSLG